jgi:molecular chaperone DnaK (HSP70)
MLIPDPCFIDTIRRASGAKRVLVHVANGDPVPFSSTIQTVTKPEWLDIEGAMMGDTIAIKKGGKLGLVVNVNTDHRFFPTAPEAREELVLDFASGDKLTIYLYIQEIISSVESFRGTFAMDFGTSNTCYAWKGRVGEKIQMSDAMKSAEVSREVPTLIRFRDISNREVAQVEIGSAAREFISRNAGKNSQYSISVKRLLGTDKLLTITDERSGLEPGRFQRYKPEEVASFAIRELIREAEGRIGQRIEQVVATFPILFNARKKEALTNAFRLAFEGLNREWAPHRLVLRMDETNAAAFSYVYSHLMDEFRRFATTTRKHRILSYDFGGGTFDVSLIDVELSRDEAGRIVIRTDMRGITGDRFLGGDTVTLAVLGLLKAKLAVRAAKLRLENRVKAAEAARARAEAEAKSKEQANNPWAIPVAGAAKTAAPADPWAAAAAPAAPGAAAAAPAAPAEEQAEDPITADIECLASERALEAAWNRLAAAGDLADAAAQWGVDIAEAVRRQAAAGQRTGSPLELKELADGVESAIDLVLPTRWKTLEQAGDLITKEVAQKLFYELWLPAEVLKIRALTDPSRQAALTEPLLRVAKYVGLRPDELMGVTISEAEINAAIRPHLTRSIGKAAHLLASVDQGAAPVSGLNFGGLAAAPAAPQVTVLLAGNGSRLPLVRELMAELCKVEPAQVVMDPKGLKATVAQGACEEHILNRDFGASGGLIQYVTRDFTSNLPCSVGVFHKELSLLGYPGGFAPVLPRGTATGTQVVITDALQVLHQRATELTMYAWFHDHPLGVDAATAGATAGVELSSLGWFDLATPDAQPWDGTFTKEVQAQVTQGPGFKMVLVLDANRDLILVRPDGKTCHRLKANPEIADDREQPFSGVH